MAEGLPPIIVELRALTGEFKAKLTEASGELHHLETSGNQSMQKLQQGGKLATVALGAGFVAAAGLSVKAGMEYQESLTGVQNSAGLTDTEVKAVGDTFLSTMGKSTFSANEMATAFGPVAGVVKQLNGGTLDAASSMEFMKGAMDASEATGLSLQSTTADLSKVMLTYGLSTKDAGETSNVLYNTSKVTGVGLDNLTMVLGKMHQKLGPLAPSLADTSSLLVDLASHGVSGSRGVAAASMAMTTLLSGTKPVKKELSTLGISVTDSAGHFKGMGEVIGELQPKLVGMTDAQRLQTEQNLFGKTAAIAMNGAIMAGAAGFDQARGAVEKKGAVDEAAANKAKTLSGMMKTVAATAEDLATKFGMVLIPWLQKGLSAISSLTDWFMKHKTIAEALAVVVGGVLVTAIAAYVAGLIVAGVQSVAAFAKMTASAVEWAAKTAAKFATWVVEQTAAMAEAAAKWAAYTAAWLAEQATAMATWVAESTAATATWIAEQAAALATSIAGAVVWSASLLASAATAAAGWLISMAGMAATAIASAAAMILPFLPLILTIGLIGIAAYELYEHWDTVWGFIKRIASDTWDFLRMIFGYIIEGGLWLIKTEVQGLENTWGMVWGGITNTVSGVWNFLRGIFNDIVQGGVWFIRTEIQGLEHAWSAVWNGITGTVAWAWDFISSVFGNIGRSVSWVLGVIGSVASAASSVGGLLSHIPGFAGGVENFGGGLAMVGENGPELVNLPRGSDVISTEKTASMVGTGRPVGGIGGGGGGNVTNIVHVHVNGGVYGQGGEAALTDHIHEGLLRKQARSPLGIMATA